MMYNTMEENLLPDRPTKRRKRDWLPGRAWFFIFGVFVGIFLPLVYQEVERYLPKPGDSASKIPDLSTNVVKHEVKDELIKEREKEEEDMVSQNGEVQVGVTFGMDHNERLAAIRKEKAAEDESSSDTSQSKKFTAEDNESKVNADEEKSKKEPGKDESGEAKNEPGKDDKKEGKKDKGNKPDVPKKPKKKKKSLNIENRYATIEVNSLYQRFPSATQGTSQVIRFSGSKEQVEKIPPFDKEISDVNDTAITVDGADYQILLENNPCIDSKYCRQYVQTVGDDEGSFMPLINTICDLLDMRISEVSSTGIEACEAFSDAIQTNLCAPLMPNITVWYGSYVRTREYLLTNRGPKKKTQFDGQG